MQPQAAPTASAPLRTYASAEEFLASGRDALAKGPVALIFAEDQTELASTILHHQKIGFREVLVFAPGWIDLPAGLGQPLRRITYDTLAEHAVQHAINAILAAAGEGVWIYYCYNAEYLFFPFCETRMVPELLAFHTEERRDAFLTYVVDLYAGDLGRFPDAVSIENAHLDRSGYYALARHDEAGNSKERQLDFFGGLRWRFEEHIPAPRRRIDRIAMFRAARGLAMRRDLTFTTEEYNTYACPWHHNITLAICSFRTAKALKANPGSTYEIPTFWWRNSTPFHWKSQQLMDLGLMEPGQWF